MEEEKEKWNIADPQVFYAEHCISDMRFNIRRIVDDLLCRGFSLFLVKTIRPLVSSGIHGSQTISMGALFWLGKLPTASRNGVKWNIIESISFKCVAVGLAVAIAGSYSCRMSRSAADFGRLDTIQWRNMWKCTCLMTETTGTCHL